MPTRHPFPRRARSLAAPLVVLLLALSVVACAREPDPETNEGTNPSPGELVVEVLLTDDSIELPDELPAGPTLFEVTNSGTTDHGFAVEGTVGQIDALNPDQLDTLRVELAPGTHTVYSPVEGDREAGLEVEIVVTESKGGDDDGTLEGVGPSEEQEPIGN